MVVGDVATRALASTLLLQRQWGDAARRHFVAFGTPFMRKVQVHCSSDAREDEQIAEDGGGLCIACHLRDGGSEWKERCDDDVIRTKEQPRACA